VASLEDLAEFNLFVQESRIANGPRAIYEAHTDGMLGNDILAYRGVVADMERESDNIKNFTKGW
jgi:hypothetical protein